MISLGLRTLFAKEVRRFLRVPGQTLLSPLITTTLYLAVFGWSLGGRLRDVEGIPYARFIVPGLVALGVVSNSYLNTASSMFVMKIQGTIVDLLVAPISYAEILVGFLGAATLRGLLVGGLTWLAAGAVGGFDLAHPAFTVLVLVLVAVVFASFGLMTAIWASSFEQVNFFPTFIITPLTFLGGVFYSAHMIPAPLRRFTLLNPVFYMVDAVRFGILGRSEAHPVAGVAVLAAVAIVAVGGALTMLYSGYKLRG